MGGEICRDPANLAGVGIEHDGPGVIGMVADAVPQEQVLALPSAGLANRSTRRRYRPS